MARRIILLVGLFLMGSSIPLVSFAATIYSNSSTGNDSTGDGSSGTPYATFHKAYTSASANDTIDLTGTFTWTDAAEAGDNTTSGYTIGKNLTIQGQGANQTIIQGATASTTGTRRVFTISSGVTAIIKNIEIRHGRLTSGYGGGIHNSGNLSVFGARIDNNIASDGGSGIDNLNILNIASSTVDHNLANGSASMGGGILSDYYIVSGGYTTITDTTIAYNTLTATTGYYSGAGIHFRKGSGTITNSTISYNESCESALGSDDSASVITIKNTIVANNLYHYGSFCSSGATVDFAYRSSGQGSVVDNGNNIVGYSNYYTWSAAGDWTDTNRDGIFVLQTAGTTGSLSLHDTLAQNNTLVGTPTLSFTSPSSIAIDNGATGTNGATSTVPTLDQRGGSRNGSTDIGAYEYNAGGLTDTTAPTVSITAPSSGGSVNGASVSLTANASDDIAVSGVKFYVDGTLQGSEDTSSPFTMTWDSTATTTGSHSIFAVARDAAGNVATSTTVSFTVDNTAPTASLTAPADGATLNGTITISANASDNIAVSGVKFYVNGVLQGSEDTTSPYSISWNSTATTSGSKIIKAVARDAANNFATSTSITITTDNTAPSISSYVPLDNATGVAATSTLTMNFTETVTAVAGKNITIKLSSGGSTFETIAANDVSKVAISGSQVVITPTGTLSDLIGYYVNIDSGAFVDGAANAYTGIANTTTWNFTTRDINPPTVSSFSPADDATGVSPTANLVIVFNENVTAVAGKNIVIKKTSDNSTVETIAANNASLVTVSSATVTINPATTLTSATGYYVQIDSGAFKDSSSLNYAGIADTTTWNFTVADATVPSVSLTTPTNGATIAGSAIGMSATASDDIGVAGVRFYVNGIAVGAEDTSAPYSFIWNSLATSSGQKVVVAVARDTSNNFATSTSATVTLTNTPTPTTVSATPAVNAATVSWTTPYEGSSRMFFGLTTATGSSTPEANTSGVTSHSVGLSGLPSCTVYKYVTVSKTTGGDVATSSQSILKTAGCTGNATITANTESAITVASGGTLTEGALTLTVPTAFTGGVSSATFQANQLNGSTFFANISPPSGKNAIGTNVYNLKALSDETTTISSFSEPLSVTLSYEASDVVGIDETTLTIHRYDSTWNPLDNCSVSTSARTVTCTTTHFSDFAIFGGSSSSSSSSSGGGGILGLIGSTTAFKGYKYVEPRPQIVYPDGHIVYLDTASSTESLRGDMTATSSAPTGLKKSSYQFNQTLRARSVGEDVRELQKFLNAEGFVIASRGVGSPGNEGTLFGPMTYNALVKFQDAHAKEILTPLGITKGTGIFSIATRTFVNDLSR